MKKLVYEKFISWKSKKNRKPLLVTGVRQCGKTYLIKEFGDNEFEDMAYFNFDGNEGLKSVFDYDFNTERIIDELGSVIYGKRIVPGQTLVVFDEIQDCPRAIQALKRNVLRKVAGTEGRSGPMGFGYYCTSRMLFQNTSPLSESG